MINPLTVAVSARSLFDLEESNKIFEDRGLQAFVDHLKKTQDEPLSPGPAFPFVRALLKLNDGREKPVVEVIVASSIHHRAGLRVVQSIDHHRLPIKRSAFIGGGDVMPYLKANKVDLLLSRSEEDAQRAINNGIAAALMYDVPTEPEICDEFQIRIALDGDAVVFDGASETIYQQEGLEAFAAHERNKARSPLAEGPFARILRFIQELQNEASSGKKPFRIALVTARGGNAQERVLRTFDAWEIEIDEVHFLNGFKKTEILKAFRPHLYFDDQHVHVDPASKFVPSGRVPWVETVTHFVEHP